MGLEHALRHGAMVGAAGDRRFSSASRADYAAAAATVLATDGHASKAYELAGDQGYTLAEFAAELSRQAGRPVVYHDLSEADYRGVLTGIGLPETLAALLAVKDYVARGDTLVDEGRALSTLIGRLTTPMREKVASAVAGERGARPMMCG